MNASSLYLQEHFGENIEFPNNGHFELDHFPDNHVIVMDGGNSQVNRTSGSGVGASFSTPIFVPTNQTNTTSINSSGASSVPPLHSQRAVRRTPIFGIKVVRADLGENGRPVNIHLHNMTAYINIYSEVEATVTSLESEVREEMGEEDLVLVMANGLHYYDQEGTRGNSVTYKLILKCCECFRKLTTMKKYSSVYFFLICYFYIFCFVYSFFVFFLSKLPGQYLTRNWMQVWFSQNVFGF